MGVFSRSWNLTKTTFRVMNKDKEIYFYPFIAFVFGIIFLIGMVFFAISLGLFVLTTGTGIGVYEYVLIFMAYLGLSFIGTFFSACVVYTAGKRFNGGNAKFFESIGFSLKRVHKIFLWSLIAATAGLIFKIIENVAEKLKGIGKFILLITNSIFGLVWRILTIFVIQGIVYHNLGPIAAIKKSGHVLKKTWGESLIKYVGLGSVQLLFVVIGAAIGLPLLFVAGGIGLGYMFLVLGLFFLYLFALFLIFNVANHVYNTALYVYAHTGNVPEGYDKKDMKDAFRNKNMKFV